MDEEGFRLVFVPVVGWNVDGGTGFDVRFHGELNGRVGGKKMKRVLTVFGSEGVLGRCGGFGESGCEEGQHFACFVMAFGGSVKRMRRLI